VKSPPRRVQKRNAMHRVRNEREVAQVTGYETYPLAEFKAEREGKSKERCGEDRSWQGMKPGPMAKRRMQ
jgi:hypothetical protein